MMFLLGFVLGGIVVGVIANRKPSLFARVVAAANAVDDKVNSTVKPKA